MVRFEDLERARTSVRVPWSSPRFAGALRWRIR